MNENVNPIMVNLVSLPNSDYFPTPSTWHSIELGAVDSSGHLPKYYEKLCGFCSELAAAAPHSDFFADAKEMLDSANDMLNSFSKQVVYEGTDEEKEKQFRVAMNKNQNVWTDFFKSLHSEGFSYKKGMQFFSNHSNTAFFNQPVEIDYGVLREGRQVNIFLQSASHFKLIIISLQDVESAFFTAVQYAMYFHSSSQKPNAQLNPSAVQKMTGLVGILMSTALEQRKRLVIFEENVKGLKEAISQLNVMVSDCNNYGIIPDQPRARTIVTEHRLTLEKSVVLMTETKKLLECCPAKAQLSEHLLDMVAEQSPLICSISAEDQVYIDVVKNIDEILQFLAKSYVLLTSEPDVGYISW